MPESPAGGAPRLSLGAPRLSLGALSEAEDAVRDARMPRVVHLGLGAFHRSHQAWFTQASAARDGEDPWGIVAFTGRRPDAAVTLAEQNGVYTLVERSAAGDTVSLVDAVIEAYDGADTYRWREALSQRIVGVVTLTVTEAGYRRGSDGGIDLSASDVASDVSRLRAGDGAVTAPGRLVDGLRARRDADAGPIAVLSCDNLPGNGDVARSVVVSLARAVDGGLADWIEANVSFVSSMVDRITPATTDDDRATVRSLTGFDDEAAVVAEPFAEWVIGVGSDEAAAFPSGRPAWETAGVRFVDDLEPYEHRKLWLLNAGHSLLAYLGLLLGHETIDEAMGDPRCVEALERLWDENASTLPLPAAEIDEARASLRERFTNPRIRHRLAQIAADGSVKLPVRVIEPLRQRRAASVSAGGGPAGRPARGPADGPARGPADGPAGIGPGAATALAAWQLHLTQQPDLVNDAGAASLGSGPTVGDVLRALAPDLADDREVVAAVEAESTRILAFLPHPAPSQGVPA